MFHVAKQPLNSTPHRRPPPAKTKKPQAIPAAYASLSDLPAADLARLLSAYAEASCYSQELFAGSTEFVWEQLPRMGPGQLADVAVAYAVVGHYDNDEDLWLAIAERTTARVQVRGWGVD